MQVLRTFSCACPWASSGRLCRLRLCARLECSNGGCECAFLDGIELNISFRTLSLPTVALLACLPRRAHLSERPDLMRFCNSCRISHPSCSDLKWQERFPGITMPCPACNRSRKIVFRRKIRGGAAFGSG